MGMRMILRSAGKPVRETVISERGFTLIEVMLGIVLMTVGLLAVADVFPRGLALSLYGKDQTKSASLAQQKVEYYKNQATSSLASIVGDYGTNVASEYFDQNGNTTTQSGAYFTRDVQIQYWTWSSSTSQFTLPTNPYTAPSAGTQYVYRVSVATHWPVRGQTTYTSGNISSPNGCVSGGAQVPTGLGCVQVSTFITP